MKGSSESTAAQLRAAQATSESQAQNLNQYKTKMDDLVTHYRDTISTLKGTETERGQLQQQLQQSKADFGQCVDRNDQLYQLNGEILNRYEHEGTFSHLARAEPFTRIKRTQLDNLALEDHQRAAELRIQQQAGTPAPKSSSTPAAAPPGGAVAR
jgi:hypothetical protein